MIHDIVMGAIRAQLRKHSSPDSVKIVVSAKASATGIPLMHVSMDLCLSLQLPLTYCACVCAVSNALDSAGIVSGSSQ